MATSYVVIREKEAARPVAEVVFKCANKARAYVSRRINAYAFVLEGGDDDTPHIRWAVSEVYGPSPSWRDIERIFPEHLTPL